MGDDLRALAAEAILCADPQLTDLYDNRRERYLGWADAVLAAVLPAHRAEVLAAAAQAIASRRSRFAKSIDCDTAIEVLGHLAATGPEVALSARQSDEQPQVPPVPPNEGPEAHSGSQGGAT